MFFSHFTCVFNEIFTNTAGEFSISYYRQIAGLFLITMKPCVLMKNVIHDTFFNLEDCEKDSF